MKTDKRLDQTARMLTGIKAIIYLQSLAGITETPAQATRGWVGMNKGEQEQTLLAYAAMKKAGVRRAQPNQNL